MNIRRIFAKKFKTRVAHYIKAKYTVQYCHYRIIPLWHSLMIWYDYGHPASFGISCWHTALWDYETAERIAEKLKSIGDIVEYYKPFEEEERKWHDAENKYWEQNVPYNKKIINK